MTDNASNLTSLSHHAHHHSHTPSSLISSCCMRTKVGVMITQSDLSFVHNTTVTIFPKIFAPWRSSLSMILYLDTRLSLSQTSLPFIPHSVYHTKFSSVYQQQPRSRPSFSLPFSLTPGTCFPWRIDL